MAEYLKGSPLQYNASTQEKFIRDVNKNVMHPLMKETEEKVNDLFEEFAAGLLLFPVLNARSRKLLNEIEKKYGVIFKRQAEKIAKAYVDDTQKYSKIGVKRNMALLSIGRSTAFKESKTNADSIYKTSNDAVKSMILAFGTFYLSKVRSQVEQAILAKNKDGISDFLENQVGITDRKTKNDSKKIYRQTYNAFNREYLQSNDLDQWQWVHTNRAHKPNAYHLKGLNGLVFNYDSNPPVIDQRTGTTGYPGYWYGCMCIMLPVVKLS